MEYVVFFHDTSTTEIYTYLHTLSLHDALPILQRCRRGGLPPIEAMGVRQQCLIASGPHCREDTLHRIQYLGLLGFGLRSEEHTSELQSLMRISYAVFCLKKKTQLPLSRWLTSEQWHIMMIQMP